MKSRSLPQVIEFIQDADLPPPLPGASRAEVPRDRLTLAGRADQQRAALVGCGILSFSEEVPAERRNAILNCALLAQLIAKRNVPDPSDLDRWYDEYFDSLTNLGWAVQQRTLTSSSVSGEEFSVHKAVLSLVASFLGESSSAYLLVKAALEALRSMNQADRWITLFNRETHSLKSAKFQIGVASGRGTDLSVALMAFALESTTDITGVLFFKARRSDVIFRESHATTAIDTAILDEIRPIIQKKLITHAVDYVLGLPDLV